MAFEIRPIRPEELDEEIRAVEAAFHGELTPEFLERIQKLAEIDRTIAAVDDGEIVAGASAITMELTVPGGILPTAGITGVGVKATHRRRGINTALMRRQMDGVRERSEPLAALWAAEGGIYGRFGFGLASFQARIDIETEHARYVRGYRPSGRVRLLEREEALKTFPAVYDAVRPTVPGFVVRDDAWWDDRFWDPPSERDGASPFYFAVHESDDGHPDAYAAYRVKHDWLEGFASSELRVEELVASSPQAYADMWRYCFDVDLIHRVKSRNRSVDEPLLHLLADPRRLRMTIGDGMFVRMVDVPGALTGRRYATEGRVVIDVRDEFCPWNEGRVELDGGPGGATCVPTDGEPDLALTATDLGAAYLGGVGFRQLHRAGRVTEHRPGALARADLMFRWDPAPWCPQFF